MNRPVATTPDQTVPSAFRLGWLVGHLYHDKSSLSAKPATLPPTELPPRLPDPSGLPGTGYAELQLAQIKCEHDALATAGLQLAATGDLETALTTVEDGEKRRGILYALDQTWLTELAEQRFKASRAYQLGRSLEDTTHAQWSDGTLTKLFNRYRISELSSWLDDLEQDLPTDNAFAVKSSLHAWTRWIEGLTAPEPERVEALPTMADPEPAPDSHYATDIPTGEKPTDAQLRGTLYRQGTIWLSLLGANTDPSTYVIAQNYVDAAKTLLSRCTELARGVGRTWWIAMTALLVAVAAVVTVAVETLSGGSRAATIIAAILAGAGVSWKAVGATIGATIKRLEEPLWKAEQRLTIAAATTRLPADDKSSGRPPEIRTQ